MSAVRTSDADPVDEVLDRHGGDARMAIAALIERLEEARNACSAGYSRRTILRPRLQPWTQKPPEPDVDTL